MSFISEYTEIKISPDNIKDKEIMVTEDMHDILAKAVEMLKMWGVFNAYTSHCGYKHVSSMFSRLYPKRDFIFIENDIDFIDHCFMQYKKSNVLAEREQAKFAELYYRGYDIVDGGADWSQRLTIREIAQMENRPKSTIYRRLKSFESYIVSKIIAHQYI